MDRARIGGQEVRGSRGPITEVTGRHGKHSGCPFKPREESLEGLRDMTQPDLTLFTLAAVLETDLRGQGRSRS